MLPYNGINEYSTVSQELGNITLLDLIRLLSQQIQHQNGNINDKFENEQVLDAIARNLGYYDRYDLKNRNMYGNTAPQGVQPLYKMLNTLAKMYGYIDMHDFVSQNETTVKIPEPENLNQSETLLKIDRRGNIWINGVVENNPTRIGKEIIKIAHVYKDNFVLRNAADYFNEPMEKLKRVEEDELPF